ncbi:phosphomannomutase/phosphoglucomutase [Desulfofundulus thermocisternus]|uniref:phosphomannomutase/phosphoglucomutase n=1 Tax=Desulfofundulus thermocisternus TaxID=42471 RepID=UPI000A9A4425|nr:phosphomannomutase/phosphoglucomutase [Desulfofundulus thermocisternus]
MPETVPFLNPSIFREYDIRGVAGKDLNYETARILGIAFGTYLREQGLKEVLVGRDNRASSGELRDGICAGLLSAGCDVLDLGLVVTPVVYFARHYLGVKGAVMVTGSHNPPEENGFKLAAGGAETIYGKEIQKLREICSLGSFAAGRGKIKTADVVPAYLDMLVDKIKLGPRPLKVVVDCGSGTAGYFAPQLLRRWGCNVIELYCTPDPAFPHHHPDPVKTANLRDLQKKVLEEGADLGVAYDGDADRLGVVDEQGNIVWGDRLMILFWREILPRFPGAPVLVEVKCSQSLVEEAARLGGKPIFSRTGHSLIKARMRELNAPFTGEMSGHMFFADEYYGYDDALYATGRLLRILSNTEKPLSLLLADVPQYYSTAETRVPCPDEVKFAVVEQLVKEFQRQFEVIDVDGARVLFEDGWGLVRASNTQPVLVARCEARTPEGLQRICDLMKKAITAHPRVGDFEWEY